VLAGFAGVVANHVSAKTPPKEPLEARIARAVQATGVQGVAVHADKDSGVTIDGMVVDAADAARVRSAVMAAAGNAPVAHRYATAADVAQSIGDALANPGLTVRYRGSGEFQVSGASTDLEGVRGKLRRIATDLGPSVSRIELAATELPPQSRLSANALMTAGDLQYVQTRDGTKHLVVVDRAAAASRFTAR
jgi:type III secretion protein D